MIVRADLPKGTQAAQIIHAAGESSPGQLPDGTYAIALAAKDEEALAQIEARLRAAGVAHVSIREPDAFWNGVRGVKETGGGLMAIGLVPQEKEVLKRHVSSLPLLR